uniref:Uncharacterized protein n=1 Tax=viral metagenome TaxID=1070528 RepID=A0A6C0AT56_9ZZZZ
MAGKKRSGLANDRRAYGCGRCYISTPTPTYDYTFTGNGVLTQAIVDENIGTAQNIFIVGYTSIGNSAFFNKSQIRYVTIGNSVTLIGSFAFAGCASLTSVTFTPTSTLATINGQAFNGCTALTSIKIPNSVTSISGNAFINSGLTTVTIANGQLGIISPDTGVNFFGATVTTQLP